MNLNAHKLQCVTGKWLLFLQKILIHIFKRHKQNVQDSLDVRLLKPRESLAFDILLQSADGEWMLGLTSSEVFDSVSNIAIEVVGFETPQLLDMKRKS